MYQQLNECQRDIAEQILNAASGNSTIKLFLVDGPGGTGKPFLYEMYNTLAGFGHEIIVVA